MIANVHYYSYNYKNNNYYYTIIIVAFLLYLFGF